MPNHNMVPLHDKHVIQTSLREEFHALLAHVFHLLRQFLLRALLPRVDDGHGLVHGVDEGPVVVVELVPLG